MSTFLLHYQLLNAGWAELKIHIEHERYEYAVSYLFDSLTDLSLKTLHMLQYEKYNGFVSFVDEPGEFQLGINKTNDLYIQLTGTWFNEWIGWEDVENPQAKRIFFYEVSILEFAHQVVYNLDEIYVTFGMSGYKEKWINDEFPYENYMKLKEVLNGNNYKKQTKGNRKNS